MNHISSFCKENHCIMKVIYFPCFDKYIVRFKKVTHNHNGQIILEQEHIIANSESPILEFALNQALAEAQENLRENMYFDTVLEDGYPIKKTPIIMESA